MEAANKARIEAELQHEEEARKHAQNVVRLAATDQLNSEIITNRTRGKCDCERLSDQVFINDCRHESALALSPFSACCRNLGPLGRLERNLNLH